MTTSTSNSSSSQRLSSRAAPFVMDAAKKQAHATSSQPQPQSQQEEAVEEVKSVEPPAPAPAVRVKSQPRMRKAAAKVAAVAAAAAAALSLDASAGQLLTGQVQLPAARATTPCLVRMLLGKQAAAHVIGHGGVAIESVRHAAAAALEDNGGECTLPFLLDLDEVRSMHTRRIATLQGALVQVQRALECILDVLMEKRALGAAAAAAKIAALPPDERPPPVKQPSDQVAITFIVPNTQLGAVIGVGGRTIAMLRRRSAAILRISEENLERSQEKSLQIVGQCTAVQYAACAVAELLCQAQLAGMPPSPEPYVLELPVRPGQQAALAALATPVPPHPHPNAQQDPPSQQQQQQQSQQPSQQQSQQQASMPPAQPILQPLPPPPPHPHPPVLMPMPMHPHSHPHGHPMPFNPVVAQLHEVTLRLQQLGIQSAHQSLYGMVNNRQLHANQMEMQQLQHVYSMLQAQLHQQSAAAAAAMAQQQQQMQPQMMPPQPMGMPPLVPSPFFRAPAGALGAALDRVHSSARNPVVLSLSIPASLMGGLIGKKGERIQSIRVASEARIKIEGVAESAQRIAEEAAAGLQSTASRGNSTLQHPQQQNPQRPASVAPLPPSSPSPSDDGGERKEREEEAAVAAPVVAVVAAEDASSPAPPAAATAKRPPSTSAAPHQASAALDRVLTLTGTQRQVELAAQLILEIIEGIQRGSSQMIRQRHIEQLSTAPQQQQRLQTDEQQQQQAPPQPQQQEQQPQPQLPGPVSNVSPVSSR